jgi:hypothetical protein
MHRLSAIPLLLGFTIGVAACGSAPTASPTADATAAFRGTWDHVNDEAGRDVILASFAGLVDSADEVVTRIGFDGSDWWQGFVFDGELFLLDGVPEGDAGSFSANPSRPVIVLTGAHGEARVAYEWAINGDSLTLTAIEECAVAAAETTCVDDRSEMDPVMLLVMDQTFTRSGDDPGY